MNNQLIQSDNPFTDAERTLIGKLAHMMIPASGKYGVPGADDAAILSTILAKGKAHESLLKKGVYDFSQLAQDQQKTASELSDKELLALMKDFRMSHRSFVQTLMTITAQSYYQDERVLKSLDLEARPPFPQGYSLQQGDWSLLDPVKQKDKIYREV